MTVAAVLAAGSPAGAADAITASVRTTGGALNARAGASTVDRVVRALAPGTRLTVQCQVYGQLIRGAVRISPFWERLADGSFVAAAYVQWHPARPIVPWCAGGARATARVATVGGRLSVRSGPRPSAGKVGSVASGSALRVFCAAWGTRVSGPVGTGPIWYGIGVGRYVAAAFVRWTPGSPGLPFCGQAPPTVPAPTHDSFVSRLAGAARATRARYGVPASVTIAQAIIESGWGGSLLTRRDHNYFGIKCFGAPGPIAIGCRRYDTHECSGSSCFPTTDLFRAYRNPAASMADHGYFLRHVSRYRNAFRYTDDPDQFVREIHKAGYATSPTYSRDLISIMRSFELYRYDR